MTAITELTNATAECADAIARAKAFYDQCESEQYTDTGELWEVVLELVEGITRLSDASQTLVNDLNTKE